ncbi:MAG TPA: organomercurial lyase [Candidatus Krumholzibacteria bacterium]|nr:organomercurial lyase [Candidatus Krumholzibacteria bacterium]
MDFLTNVKLAIYRTIAETTHAPTVADVAQQLGARVDDVQNAFAELHAKHLLVPEPGDPTRIRMAPPFSGVSTPFRVTVNAKTYHANCVWDALGIPAALHADGMVRARDAHSKESMTLVIRHGSPKPTPCVVHFAVPAAHWWDDVIYT